MQQDASGKDVLSCAVSAREKASTQIQLQVVDIRNQRVISTFEHSCHLSGHVDGDARESLEEKREEGAWEWTDFLVVFMGVNFILICGYQLLTESKFKTA